jgi:hypothetical protein
LICYIWLFITCQLWNGVIVHCALKTARSYTFLLLLLLLLLLLVVVVVVVVVVVGGGAVGCGTALQTGMSRVRSPIVPLEFFVDNPSSHNLALGLTQRLTEMSTRNTSWG